MENVNLKMKNYNVKFKIADAPNFGHFAFSTVIFNFEISTFT